MGICYGAIEDEPAKSTGDGALEATGASGSDEAGSVGRGAVDTGTGGGESGTGPPPPPPPPPQSEQSGMAVHLG